MLLMQKRAWKDFSRKYKLRYKNTAFMHSPTVNGIYKGYSLGIFSSEHELERGVNTRKMTAIEIELDSRMPFEGAIGNGGMVSIVQSLGYSDELQPAFDVWSTEYICRSQDRGAMEAYLTQERVEALVSLMKTKNVWVIFVFKGNDTLLRIDTPEAFEKEEKLTKIIDRMIDVAKLMELKEHESRELTAIHNRRNTGTPTVKINDEYLAFAGLELEEDELQQSESVAAGDDQEAVVDKTEEPQPGQ